MTPQRYRVGVRRARGLQAFDSWCSLPRTSPLAALGQRGVVRVDASSGRSALARLQFHDGPEALLARSLRVTLQVRVGDEIAVEAASAEPVAAVTFIPAADLSRMLMEGVEGVLKTRLLEHGTLLSPDLILYLPLGGGGAGTFFKVKELDGGPGEITADTAVRVAYSAETQWTEVSQRVGFAEVGGLGPQLEAVREMVELPLLHPYLFRQMGITPPKGLIFHGPPGTGKTHLARAVAGELNARFFYINGADVAGRISMEAGDALRKTFAEATTAAPAIILIDELDALAPRRGETGLHSDTKLVAQLLTLMDGLIRLDGITVIATTNRVNMIDAALRRPGRFERELLFGAPDAADRLVILDIHTREMPLDDDAVDHLPQLAAETSGYTGADLMEVAREAALAAVRRSVPLGRNGSEEAGRYEDVTVSAVDFEEATRKIRPSALRELYAETPTERWTDVGGLDDVKARLHGILDLRIRNPQLVRDLGLSPTAGILLHGPAGTGKSLLAKAAAGEFGLHLLWIRGPEVFSKWMGESEEGLRRVFTLAREVAPCILFLDQLEAIAAHIRAEDAVSAPARVLHQLLVELDDAERNRGLVVMAAASSLERLDPSVLRSGRFGHHVTVPLPNRDERLAIARIHLAPAEPYLAEGLDAVAGWIADATEGLSGADLKGLCDEARYAALVRAGTSTAGSRPVVGLDDFRHALADQHGRRIAEEAAAAPTPMTHRAVG